MSNENKHLDNSNGVHAGIKDNQLEESTQENNEGDLVDEKEPMYEVHKTLIIGKQSVKTSFDSDGNPKVSHHKKATGYVLKNRETGELEAVAHIEAPEYAVKYGIENAIVVIHTTQKPGGVVNKSPYIKTVAGGTPLQNAYYVVCPHRYLKNNPDVKVTPQLARDLNRTKSSRGRGSKTVQKYTKDELLQIINDKKDQLN